LAPRKDRGTHLIGGWKGRRSSLDVLGKKEFTCSCWNSNLERLSEFLTVNVKKEAISKQKMAVQSLRHFEKRAKKCYCHWNWK